MVIKSISRPWLKEENHRHNHRNGDRSFYQSKTWKAIRDAFLSANPYCVECEKEGKKVKATVADHKTQRINSGSDDFSNLQGLCSSHHNAKSARERNQMYKK